MEVIVSYEKQNEFEYICKKNGINIISKDFADKIKNSIEISEEKYIELFQKNEKSIFQNLPIFVKENRYINKS